MLQENLSRIATNQALVEAAQWLHALERVVLYCQVSSYRYTDLQSVRMLARYDRRKLTGHGARVHWSQVEESSAAPQMQFRPVLQEEVRYTFQRRPR